MKSNVWGAALTVNLKISMNEYYLTALVTQTFNFISRVFFWAPLLTFSKGNYEHCLSHHEIYNQNKK